ncbi:MAG: helix-turn-helix transcriptional regulator [Beijerinckiaceae bacterium]
MKRTNAASECESEMPAKRNPHRGSTLHAFLKAEGVDEQATAIAVKRIIAFRLRQAMAEQKLSKTDMAARMSTSRRQLDRVLNPDDGNVTLETLQRAAVAVGRSLRLELT